MRNRLTLLLLLLSLTVSAQFKFNDVEYFTVSTFMDPSASVKEKGLDIGVELEYVGFIYAKVGFESFSALKGGYFDGHGAVGVNLMYNDKWRNYTGIRLAIVKRNGATNPLFGIEGGIDYNIADNLFLGLRATYDYRGDAKAFGWDEFWRASGFIRLGYKWDY